MTQDTRRLGDRLRSWVDRFLSVGPWLRVLAILATWLVVACVFALLALIVAPADPDGPRGFGAMMWWAVSQLSHTGASGMEVSAGLRFLGVVGELTGLVFFALLVGFTTAAVAAALGPTRRRGPLFEFGHTLILGASEKLFTILGELDEASANRPRGVLVILSELDPEKLEARIHERLGAPRHTRVVVRQGSPWVVNDLRLAGAGKAASLVVLSDQSLDGRGDDADASTVKTLLALRRIPEALTHNHAVVELGGAARRSVLEQVGGEGVELVPVKELPVRMLAEAVRQSGLVHVYRELLAFKGCEFYSRAFPQLAGRQFGKAQWHVDGAVVCGVRQAATGRIILNPPDELLLEAGDELLIIAEDAASFTLVAAKEPVVPPGSILALPVPRRSERLLVCGSSPRLGKLVKALDQQLVSGSEVWLMPGWNGEAFAEFLRAEVGPTKNLRFKHVEGDPTLPADIARAVEPGVSEVLIVAESSRGRDEADARTLITVLLLRDQLRQQGGAQRRRLIAELLDPRSKALLEPDPDIELVVPGEMTAMLLAQISQRRELNRVFAELFEPSGQRLYLKRAACFAPMGYPTAWQLVQKAARQRKEVAIGYLKEGGRPILNPPHAESVTLDEEDRVIVLAPDDVEGRDEPRLAAEGGSSTLTRARSGLLPPVEAEEPRTLSAGPRVKGPSTEPRPPLPGKPKG
jgi:ion channel POLLUX/CASTOR